MSQIRQMAGKLPVNCLVDGKRRIVGCAHQWDESVIGIDSEKGDSGGKIIEAQEASGKEWNSQAKWNMTNAAPSSHHIPPPVAPTAVRDIVLVLNTASYSL